MKMKGLYAILVLGIQLLVHSVRWLFRRPSPGLSTFLANYRDDGIPAMSSKDKDLLDEISRCVSCRLCDSACPALVHSNPADFMGPSFYPSSVSRLIPDYPYAMLDLELCNACNLCEDVCPRQVPIKATFDLIRRKVEAIAA